MPHQQQAGDIPTLACFSSGNAIMHQGHKALSIKGLSVSPWRNIDYEWQMITVL